jgi:SPP1 family predicted phage head-tail adaptor
MNLGRLDRRIDIESWTWVANSQGEKVATYSVFHAAFAHVQKAGGNEREEGQKETATNKVKFKIQFFDGIDETMRILYNSKYYDILEIQELGREGLWITANRKK